MQHVLCCLPMVSSIVVFEGDCMLIGAFIAPTVRCIVRTLKLHSHTRDHTHRLKDGLPNHYLRTAEPGWDKNTVGNLLWSESAKMKYIPLVTGVYMYQ